MSDVTIPGVSSSTVEEVTVLRMDQRFDAIMETHYMLDGSRKILITSAQPYIEVTIPAKEAP